MMPFHCLCSGTRYYYFDVNTPFFNTNTTEAFVDKSLLDT